MTSSYLSRSRYTSESHQNPVIGFLDINFGVLGIFLIVFTIRLVVVAQPAGESPDIILAVYQVETSQSQSGFEVFFKTPPESTLFSGNKDEVRLQLIQIIAKVIATGKPSARLMILVPPDGFDAELTVSNSLQLIENSLGDDFLPFVSVLRPVLDNEGIQTIVADWRGGVN